MNYAKSFLPESSDRWTQSQALVSKGVMEIMPGGWVATSLTEEDTPIVFEKMRLTIIATTYTDTHTPTDFVEISVITLDGDNYNILCPIVNTGNDIYTVELETMDAEFTEFRISIRSVYGIRITSWELSGPAGGDNTELIKEIRGELPKLLYNYNTARFDIGQQETTIALISSNLLKATDLNAHIQLTYTASQDAQLIIRAKDNGVSELFTPIMYDIKAGRGSIGIPHAYLDKNIGIHTFTITAQVSVGNLFFDVRSVLYTIDGGYLAERVMDVGMDVQDIALRRSESEGSPSWIYAIGIDDGEGLVRARPYSDIVETAWEPMYTIGGVKECCIEFGGNWRIDGRVFRLDTDEHPWMAWINEDDELMVRYSDDEETVSKLAEGVSKLTMIRGYTNINFIENDQGLVVMYIKEDGLVYYRSRVTVNENKIWDSEYRVEEFTGTAVGVNSFRTNDYRIGFNIMTSSKVETIITDRNWAGIAVRPEKLVSKLGDLAIDLHEVTYHTGMHTETISANIGSLGIDCLYASTVNAFTTVANIPDITGNHGLVVRFTLDHSLTSSPGGFSLYDENDTVYPGLEISTIGLNEYEVIFLDFNNAAGDMVLVYDGVSGVNEAGYTVATFSKAFTPIGLVPVDIPVPEVEVIWNE